jgi:multiple antibiotic resistance protein
MPFIIGPGTISASVLAGSRLDFVLGSLAISLALAAAIGSIILLKKLHDMVQTRSERYVERYVEVAGRVTGLFTGSFAVEMILKGIERWLHVLHP